jgi:predicted acetyltransferase
MRLENIRFSLPEDDPFIEFLKPLGLRKELQYRKNNGGMVRMINIPAALRKVGQELAGRMSGPGRLNLRTNLDAVGLAWSGGKMTVGRPIAGAPSARLPQWALAQMLYGYRTASALAMTGLLKAPPRAVGTLDRMLPQAPHFHYAVDKF